MKRPLPHLVGTPIADMPLEVCGPYSPWPRKSPKRSRKAIAITTTTIAAGVFLHCAMPLVL